MPAPYRKAKHAFREAFENAPIGVALVATDGRFMKVNAILCELLGYQEDELLTMDFKAITHPRDLAGNQKDVQRLFDGAIDVMATEKRYLRKDGQPVWTLLHASLVRDHEGSPLYYVSQIVDITARKQANDALAESEERLILAQNALKGGIWDWNISADTFYFSDKWLETFGYRRSELPETTTAREALVHPDDRDALRGSLQRYFDSQEENYLSEYRMRHRDGNWVWIQHTGYVTNRNAAGKPTRMVGTDIDITDRKEAEQRIQDSEARFKRAIQGTADGLWDWDILANTVWYAPRFRELIGYTEEEFPNELASWQRALHPEDRDHTWDAIQSHLDDDTPFNIDYRLQHKDGSYHWFHARAAVIRNSDGRPVRMAGSIRDISNLKAAEAAIVSKNQDLETLLYVTSHDLREPLRAIQNFSKLVHDRYAHQIDEKGREFLARITRGANRMEQLIKDVLSLSRAQRMEEPRETVNLNEVVTDVLQSLSARIADTSATIQVSDELPTLVANRTWVTQALYNLINNAIKFTKPGETPDIDIVPYQLRPTHVGGNVVAIAVRDRGIGIEPQYADRIFRLFQRAVGREIEGTGAGLAIVKQVAERHGGRVWAAPRDGGGTEFVMTFAQSAHEQS